ncbi:MAG: ROK family protein [Chitinispirillales bacterium]|jgi:glucokinase|nr:ROK family protein [Chitinispirillales bacterium]
MKKVIGIDLGGTSIKGVVMGEDGAYGEALRIPTEAYKGGEHVLASIMSLIGELLGTVGDQPVAGVGIGTPGFVDGDGTILGGAENLPGWKGVQIYAPITERYGLPVAAANDVTAVALAELKFGAGRGVKNIVCFALGTGVGGGIVIDGKLYAGSHGMAGELGHIVVETGGLQCACGQNGCLERYSSATGIVRLAIDYASSADVDTPFARLVRKNPAEITAKIVYEYVAQADSLAMKVHHTACEMLGRAAGIMMNALSPDRIVLGGGVMMAGDIITNTVKTYAARSAWPAIFERCEVVPAQMGEDAGVMGAGALALERF